MEDERREMEQFIREEIEGYSTCPSDSTIYHLCLEDIVNLAMSVKLTFE